MKGGACSLSPTTPSPHVWGRLGARVGRHTTNLWPGRVGAQSSLGILRVRAAGSGMSAGAGKTRGSLHSTRAPPGAAGGQGPARNGVPKRANRPAEPGCGRLSRRGDERGPHLGASAPSNGRSVRTHALVGWAPALLELPPGGGMSRQPSQLPESGRGYSTRLRLSPWTLQINLTRQMLFSKT